MKKFIMMGLICGLTASCAKNYDTFEYKQSKGDDTITVYAESWQYDGDIILLEQPSVETIKKSGDEKIVNNFYARRGQLNKSENILTLSDNVHVHSSNGDNIKTNTLDIKM